MLASTNLAVRFLLELGALGAVGYWGAHTGGTTLTKVVLAAGLPLALAIIWGTFVAPNASVHVPGTVHVALQVLVFGAAAAAFTQSTASRSRICSAARSRSTRR